MYNTVLVCLPCTCTIYTYHNGATAFAITIFLKLTIFLVMQKTRHWRVVCTCLYKIYSKSSIMNDHTYGRIFLSTNHIFMINKILLCSMYIICSRILYLFKSWDLIFWIVKERRKRFVRKGIWTPALIWGPEISHLHPTREQGFLPWVWRLRPLGHPDFVFNNYNLSLLSI